jgi:hypothetical protein
VDRLRALLATQELVVTTRSTGSQHINPLVRAGVDAVASATRLARLLGLAWDPNHDGDDDQPANIYARQHYEQEGRS